MNLNTAAAIISAAVVIKTGMSVLRSPLDARPGVRFGWAMMCGAWPRYSIDGAGMLIASSSSNEAAGSARTKSAPEVGGG